MAANDERYRRSRRAAERSELEARAAGSPDEVHAVMDLDDPDRRLSPQDRRVAVDDLATVTVERARDRVVPRGFFRAELRDRELDRYRDRDDTARFIGAYLRPKIADGGRVRMVPTATLKTTGRALARASRSDCKDEACQIELGRPVAAEKLPIPELLALDDRCIVGLTMFALESETAERAATRKTCCGSGALCVAVDELAARLASPRVATPVDAERSDPSVDGVPVRRHFRAETSTTSMTPGRFIDLVLGHQLRAGLGLAR